jgi:hypothetical protein
MRRGRRARSLLRMYTQEEIIRLGCWTCRRLVCRNVVVCVFITVVPNTMLLCLLLQYLIQSCARGGRRIVEDMCYEIRRAEACVD